MRKHIQRLLVFAIALAVMACVFTAVSAEVTHKHEYVTITAPTCTESGLVRCDLCGYEVPVSPIGHVPGTTSVVVDNPPTCISAGSQHTVVYCQHCGDVISVGASQTIPALGHDYSGTYQVTDPPTCTSAGVMALICSRCGAELNPITVSPTGHSYGAWQITDPATCTTSGQQTRTCSQCGATESQTIPAKGHSFGSSSITPATCTTSGEQTRTCTVCGYTETITLPPTGHTYGGWEYTTSATCTSAGTATQTCINCGATNTRSVPALGHAWTGWYVTTPATCTSTGVQERTCPSCGKTETQTIPALGHNWSQWQITSAPTSEHTGLYQRSCSNCGEIETQIIPKLGLQDTLCAFGLRLKDVGSYLNPAYNTWYMFTPFDASVEGMQTYELVVNDAYIVGTGTLTVLNGEVSFNYTLNSPGVQVEEEFFTIVNKMTDLHEYEPEELMSKYALKTNTPYSISQQFGGDTNLVLYMCCRVRFEYDATMTDLNYNSTYHTALVNVMTSMLDK